MAVNLYTPVVTTGWYRIIPETSTNTWQASAFTPAETYKFRSDWYYNQWDNVLWDAYKALRTWSDAFSNIAKQVNDFYSQYWDDVYKREMALGWVKSDLANRLYWDMNQQRQYIMDTFWPNWSLTNEINQYYDDLGNYLSTDAWRQAAAIAAQWIHSWASLWAIRAQQNNAYNESFARYVQAKEQELNAKQQIATNLINYMSTLRQEYWDTTNQYIISQYQRANDLLNAISKSIAEVNAEIAGSKLSQNNSNEWKYFYDIMWNLVDINGKIIKTKAELDAEANASQKKVGTRFPSFFSNGSSSGSGYVVIWNN